jgi:hypothetical protein
MTRPAGVGPAPAAGREQSRQARARPGETIVKLAKRTGRGLRPVANRLAGASDRPTAGSADRARPSRLIWRDARKALLPAARTQIGQSERSLRVGRDDRSPGGRVSERKLRRELLPIANGARESCAASRLMESSALWSSRMFASTSRHSTIDKTPSGRERGGHDNERDHDCERGERGAAVPN